MSVALVCIVAPYLGYYIVQQRLVLLDMVARLHAPALLAAGSMTIIMLALNSIYHVLTIRRMGGTNDLSGSRIVFAYAASQVIRYLPGKVFGVVYEATQLAPHIPAYRVLAANVVQGFNTNGFTLGILACAGLWVYSPDSLLPLAALLVLLVVAWGIHRFHFTEQCLAWAARRIPKMRHMTVHAHVVNRGALAATVLLLATWVAYYLSWAFLLQPEGDSIRRAILIGSCYAGASMVANFAVVMPSGLIVREALFLWAGTQASIDASTLILLGVISRLLYTLADVAYVLLVLAYDKLSALARQ